MLSTNDKKIIKYIYTTVKDKNIIWAIVGSANMALNGIDVKPNDIDIITTPNDLKIFSRIFKQYITKPICKKAPCRKGCPEFYELKLNIDDIEIHLVGEEETDVYFSRIKKENINFCLLDDCKIPCINLKLEAEAYESTNRMSKVKLLKDFLEKRSINEK